MSETPGEAFARGAREGIEREPVRDLFPQKPADRGAINYPPPRDSLAPPPTRRAFFAGEFAKARAWWRRHWWPARIRDLEDEIERLMEDWR